MIKRILMIIAGSVFIGIGINYFIIPNHLINGGIIGLGLIAKYNFNVKPGLTIIVLSLPLYAFAWFHFRTYFYNGLHGLLLSAFFIDLFQPLSTLPPAPILFSALTGGVFVGTGVGIMLLMKTSTAGGDLLALMISHATAINVGLIILMIDIIVILYGSYTIREATMFYSFLMILMIGFTTYTITKKFAASN